PSLAAMERVSKSFYRIIRSQHSPYRFLYYKLLAMYCPVDASSMIENDEQERAIHAPVLPKIQKTLAKKEFREYKVSDWKVCTICAEPGDLIPVWEVRLCKFCVVRQLINKNALFAFSLTPKEIEVLRPWKTYVYDLGMHCTFYLRSHLDHLRRQKYSDPQIALDRDVEQHLKLKPDLSVMEEWWFPKELKLEIQEYISNKTNNSLARKRLRISMEQDNTNSNNTSNTTNGSSGVTSSDSLTKSKSLRKNLDDIMTELRNVVVPRVSRLMDLNSRLMADGIAVDKLRMELDLYDDFILGGMPIEDYPLTAAITRGEILAYFTRESIFENSILSTWYSSITSDDFYVVILNVQDFYVMHVNGGLVVEKNLHRKNV
ncbi:22573_t:CDS:2, partial [Gigaspora rosea]